MDSGKHHGLISHVGALRPCTLSAGLSHGDHKSANKDKIKILNKFDLMLDKASRQ